MAGARGLSFRSRVPAPSSPPSPPEYLDTVLRHGDTKGRLFGGQIVKPVFAVRVGQKRLDVARVDIVGRMAHEKGLNPIQVATIAGHEPRFVY